MEGVARVVTSTPKATTSTGTSIGHARIRIDHHHEHHQEDFDNGTPPFSYDTAIRVMESSGQDVLELEMNHNIGYLDAREFGRAASFDSLRATSYEDDHFTDLNSYEAASAYEYAEPTHVTRLDEADFLEGGRGNEMNDTPIDHTGYSQPPITEFRIENKASSGGSSLGGRQGNQHSQNHRPIQIFTVKQHANATERMQPIRTNTTQVSSRLSAGDSLIDTDGVMPAYSVASLHIGNNNNNNNAYSGTPHNKRSGGGRSQAKKELLDPNVVEEEVARNVSQILSLTKQHRAAMEANSRPGQGPSHLAQRTPPPLMNRAVYTCSDCNKQVSSPRNLSRHRQSCPASRRFGQQSSQVPVASHPLAQSNLVQGGMASPPSSVPGSQHSNVNAKREDGGYPDWCSPRSSSVSTVSSIRDTISSSHPPSRDEGSIVIPIRRSASSQDTLFAQQLHERINPSQGDETGYANNGYSSTNSGGGDDEHRGYSLSFDGERPHSNELATTNSGGGESGSASRSSDAPNPAQAFQCEACQKTVASLRSLKRHHTTCKPFAQQFPHILEQEKVEAEVRRKKYEEQRLNAAVASLDSPARKRIRKKPLDTESQGSLGAVDVHHPDGFTSPDPSYVAPISYAEDAAAAGRLGFSSRRTVDVPEEHYLVQAGTSRTQYRSPSDNTYPPLGLREPSSTYTPQLDHLGGTGGGQVEFWSPYEGGPPNHSLHVAAPRQSLHSGQTSITYQSLQPAAATQPAYMGQAPSRQQLVQINFHPHQGTQPQWMAYGPPPGQQGMVPIGSPFSPGGYQQPFPANPNGYHHQPQHLTHESTTQTDFQTGTFSGTKYLVQESPKAQFQKSSTAAASTLATTSTPPEQATVEVDRRRLPSPDSSSTSNGVNQANTTCPDCQRQLCSASNLKRHRATCKAASTGSSETTTQTAQVVQATSPPKSAKWTPAENKNVVSTEPPERKYVVLTSSQANHLDLHMEPQRPFITVGEHLKAQQQKINPAPTLQQLQRYEPGIQIVQQGMQLGSNSSSQLLPKAHPDALHTESAAALVSSVNTHQPHPVLGGRHHSMDSGILSLQPASTPLPTGGHHLPPAHITQQRSQSTTNNYSQQCVPAYVNGGHLQMNGHRGASLQQLDENHQKLEEDLDDSHGDYEVDEHYGYGFNSATDVSDLEDDLRDHKEYFLLNGGNGEYSNHQTLSVNQHGQTVLTTVNGTNQQQPAESALRAALDSISPPLRHTISSQPLSSTVEYRAGVSTAPPLSSIITTQPLSSERTIYSSQNKLNPRGGSTYYLTPLQSLSPHQSPQTHVHHQHHDRQLPANPMGYGGSNDHSRSPNMTSDLQATPATPGREVDLRFQCPECLKTYSCRKNVKRHRMAVHKLTPDEVARNPGPVDQSSGIMVQSPPQVLLSSQTPVMMNSPVAAAISPNKATWSDGSRPSQTHPVSIVRTTWAGGSQGPLQSAQIIESFHVASKAARKEQTSVSKKFSTMTELAEADTTFSEDVEEEEEDEKEEANTEEEPLAEPENQQIDVGENKERSPNSRTTTPEPLGRRILTTTTTHTCVNCQRVLATEYSLKRHRLSCTKGQSFQSNSIESVDPMIAHGNSVAPQPRKMIYKEPKPRPQSTDGGMSFEEETVPDSTTQRGVDYLGHSPCTLSSPSDSGDNGIHIRKRRHSASEISAPPTKQNLKHLCQHCGKTYSSEWNLERHKRESCPSKGTRSTKAGVATLSPNPQKSQNDQATEDTVMIVGSVKFAVSRQALSRSSAYFASLFQLHEQSQGDVHVDVDPNEFQMLLDAHNNPSSITVSNIDAVALLAEKLKFTTVYEHCEKYILEKLPQASVMHAIRLAEQLKLSAIKQRLFDSISIEVFRALSADQDYQSMGADLKAELLEKWGTFL